MRYAIGIGASGYHRVELVEGAIVALARTRRLTHLARSGIHLSIGVGTRSALLFANAATILHTALGPKALLLCLRAIEQKLGRVRTHKNQPRLIDLDVLWAEYATTDATITIPHPRFAERAFAYEPTLEALSLAGLARTKRNLQARQRTRRETTK